MAKTTKDWLAELSDEDLHRSELFLRYAGGTKPQIVFAILAANRNNWVPMPALAGPARSRSIGSVIQGLRKHGCVIENRTECRTNNGPPEISETKSWYRLLKTPIDTLREREAAAKANLL